MVRIPPTYTREILPDEQVSQANKPTLTNPKPKGPDNPSPKPSSSNKATHGSLTSAATGRSQGSGGSRGGNRDAHSGNGQGEAWGLQKWLEQAPRDEPWRPGTRAA
ncbi:MAG: hypothetical protein Q9161_001407 [Pseudevernia consocians]